MSSRRAARAGAALMIVAAAVVLIEIAVAPSLITDTSEGIDFVPQIVLVFVAGGFGTLGVFVRRAALRRQADERFLTSRIATARVAEVPSIPFVSALPDPFFRSDGQRASTSDAADTNGVV